ncbi:hypothetical protein [Gracilibacillus kekensis]|uniref:Uncharacterized protein n=1 Tax=Gracilibacillus kekensis TaxID=1027249 RepID=A0A1M7P3R1_9BACI|nr:hypothetical protein [Gracilibacillus kekensis]SHN10840.1 hypothetical protein SAMN05216179_1935 [Gracilibacillus kekensis]
MNKWFVFLIILLAGCQPHVEKYDYQDQTYDKFVADQPDYFNYIIIKINTATLEIAPIPDELDASYGTETLAYKDNTIVEGKKHNLNDLEVNDRIDAWTNDNKQIQRIKVKEAVDNTY